MRNSKNCTKCQSTDVIRIPGVIGAYGSGNNIPVGMTIYSSVKITRYLCAACGFIEQWVEAAEDRAKIKKKYAP
ncbi:MAG TPA: hypothetical protein VGN55_18800 [Xanthobacteraceae bacterium]